MANAPAANERREIPARLSAWARLPAWATSVTVHVLLFVLLLFALGRVAPRGAAEEPGRQVGIVLRRADADGDPYVGEEDSIDQTDTTATDGQSTADLTSTLPDADASNSAKFLPQATGIGPQSGDGDATAMTQGGGSPRRTASGGDAVVQVFGVEGAGTKFVYAFDRSVSMGGGRLAAAKRQLIESLGALESIHQFQIIFFNQSTTTPDLTGGQQRIAFANDQNKRLAERFVEGVIADGGTDRFAALRKALAFRPDVVFFLTDADDPMSPAEMAQIDRRNGRVGATICTIEFGTGPAHRRNNFLKQLATSTGGQYGYVDTNRLSR